MAQIIPQRAHLRVTRSGHVTEDAVPRHAWHVLRRGFILSLHIYINVKIHKIHLFYMPHWPLNALRIMCYNTNMTKGIQLQGLQLTLMQYNIIHTSACIPYTELQKAYLSYKWLNTCQTNKKLIRISVRDPSMTLSSVCINNEKIMSFSKSTISSV